MANRSIHDILNHLPLPVFVLDDDPTVVAWNGGVEALYGQSRDDIIGSDEYLGRDGNGNPRPTTANNAIDNSDTVIDKTEDEWRERPWLDQVVVTGTRVIETTSGDTHHFRIFVVPVYEDGEVVGAVEYLKDRIGEIVAHVEDIQTQTDHTTTTVTETDETIDEAVESVEDALSALEEVATLVDEITTNRSRPR